MEQAGRCPDEKDNGRRVSVQIVPRRIVDASQVEDDAISLTPPRAYGPMIRLLATSGPMIFVVGSNSNHVKIAKSIAHDIYLNHRTDAEIIDDQEASQRVASGSLGEGSVVVLGRPEENRFTRWMLSQGRIPRASCPSALRFD